MSGDVLTAEVDRAPWRGKTISEAKFRRMWGDASLSITEIGRRLGIGCNAVRSRAATRGLGERPIKHPRMSTKKIDDEAMRKLWVAGTPIDEICAKLGVGNASVRLAVQRLGLAARPRGGVRGARAMQVNGSDERLREMWEAGVRRDDIAAYFGFKPSGIRSAVKTLGLSPRAIGGPNRTITLDEFLQIGLARKLAESAARTQAEMIRREMADCTLNGSIPTGFHHAKAARS